MCDLRHCIFTCFFEAMFSRGIHDGSSNESLNRCTLCDELRCGPAFIECAGANRRRTGILSDIERSDQQVCAARTEEWWRDPQIRQAWREKEEEQRQQAVREEEDDRGGSKDQADEESPPHRLRRHRL